MSVTEAALQLGITRQQLHRVLAEQSGIYVEMALRLGRFCGNGETVWIRMQEAFDLWHARKTIAADLIEILDRRLLPA